MTDDTVHLTRRKILAGLSAIGASGAAAGLGTSAFFSDTESFDDNAIAAGELDLAVDWEEHYSFPAGVDGDEFGDPTDGLGQDVVRTDPGDSAYVGLPYPDDPLLWVHEDDLEAYMANTAIEAFPDPDDDGQQELSGTVDGADFTYDPCEHGARLPEHLDPTGLRTDNADTNGEGSAAPLVNLQDVKPGDFGEFTLSFHLCGNPGYVWLRADDVSEAENGLRDAERAEDETPDRAELASAIQTAWWYDTDGDNVLDQSSGPVDVMLAVDTSDSLNKWDVKTLAKHANDLASELDSSGSTRVGGLTFGDDELSNFTGLADGPVTFSGVYPDGNTPLPAALEIAAAELEANGRPDAKTVVVVFSDGGPNYRNHSYAAGGYTVGADYERGHRYDTVTDGELCETASIAADLRDEHTILSVGIDDERHPTGNRRPRDCDGNRIASLSQYLRDYLAGSPASYFHADDIESLGPLLEEIQTTIETSEQVFHRGTLADDLQRLSSGFGIPLDGDLTSDFDELADDPAVDARECFQPGVTTYVGFAWWLPLETGNEIQSDSVSFDLGLYAEQCRNNDGGASEP